MPVYTNPIVDQEPSPKVLYYVDNKCAIFTCNASPEGVILANTGSIALSDNGSVFKKTTDDVNTGWIELTGGTVSSPFSVSGTNPTISLVDTTGGDDDGTISMDADVMSIGVTGGTLIQIRSNGQILGYPKTLVINTTTVNSTGAGPDTLHSFSLPANSLAANGDTLQVIYSGRFAADDDDKSFRASFGGTEYLNRGIGNTDLDSAIGFCMIAEITRLSSTSVRVSALFVANVMIGNSANVFVGTSNSGGINSASNVDIGGLADLNANATTMIGQGSGVNAADVVQNFSRITLTQF